MTEAEASPAVDVVRIMKEIRQSIQDKRAHCARVHLPSGPAAVGSWKGRPAPAYFSTNISSDGRGRRAMTPSHCPFSINNFRENSTRRR